MASSSRDVATVDILEKATLPLQSLGIALKDSHKIWKAMGLCLERQLRYGKQIKFENFGTFGFSKTFEPIFIHDSNFLQSNRLKDGNKTSSTMLCSDPINKLSTVQILEENKTIVTTNKEAIKNLFINAIVQVSKFVKEGNRATIRLGFLPVGEWHCDGVTAKMKFVPEFVQKIKNETAKTRGPLRVGRHPCEEEEEEEEDDDDDEKLTASALKKHESSTSKRPSSARSSTLLDSTVSQHQHQPRQVHISVRPQSAHEAGTQEKSVRSSVASSSASAIKKSSSKFKEEAPVTKSAKGKSGSDGRNILERVKNKIIERGGANGINSLSRVLRIMDSSGDGKLCRNELKFGLRDFGIDISPSELEALMCYFDRNKDGQISVEEFLIGIRGDINSRRLGFIHKAFRLMDRTGDGMISVEDLRDNYDVSFFPEVRAGKKSKDQALAEFMSQWDTGEKDGQITLEEFIDYYRNISAAIDDDSYFELMMRNAWHISGGEGWCANTSNKRVLARTSDGKEQVMEMEDDFGLNPRQDKEKTIAKLRAKNPNVQDIELKGPRIEKSQIKKSSSMMTKKKSSSIVSAASSIKSSASTASTIHPKEEDEFFKISKILKCPPCGLDEITRKLGANRIVLGDGKDTINLRAFALGLTQVDRTLSQKEAAQLADAAAGTNKSRQEVDLAQLYRTLQSRFGNGTGLSTNGISSSGNNVIDRVRAKIYQRGGSQGINGLQRLLRIMDNNGDKRLTKDELKQGLRDFGVEVNFQELDHLFTYFDTDRSGTISFDEFLVGMRGEMSKRRLDLVHLAFKILDKNGDGSVTLKELSKCYDTSKHPDVLSGKFTKDEALQQFMSVWETDKKDGIITKSEFETYYKNISASIDGDDYFELMMRNAWHISGGTGQYANTSNRRVLVTKADGTKRVEEIENDLGIHVKDEEKMRKKLKDRGIDVGKSKLELHGYTEQMDKSKRKKEEKLSGSSKPTSSKQPTSTARPSSARVARPSSSADRPTSARIRTATSECNKEKLKAQRESERKLRERAAQKVQAHFRGHKSRKFVDTVKRKVTAEQERKRQQEDEDRKAADRKINRPALKSYHGF